MTSTGLTIDTPALRAQFPALAQEVHGHPLAYLDNAASTQKPQAVIDAVTGFYARDNANIHRGVHALSARATASYEGARATIAAFIAAPRSDDVVFVRGATEGINLVAQSWARPRLEAGDEILITHLEHHSNIVPWQMLCSQTGAVLRVAPIDDDGVLDLGGLRALLGDRTKIVAFTSTSNAIGTITPVAEICALARDAGAISIVDAAQSLAHTSTNVVDLGCDFLVASGHKMYGPSGIGFVFGREELLEAMEPWQGGGEMILSVTHEKTSYNRPPFRFEAGTPNIAGAIGLGAAVTVLEGIGMDAIEAAESALLSHGRTMLEAIDGIRLVGTAPRCAPILCFSVEGVHPHDVGTVLDHLGIAIRTGHHCAEPLMQRFDATATCRASMAFYNHVEELDRLGDALGDAVGMLA